MNTEKERAAILETNQRVTRIESRLCRIAEALRVDVSTPTKQLDITFENPKVVYVSTAVLDVTLSEVVRFLTRQGKQGKIAHVFFNDSQIATVYPSHVGGHHVSQN